MTCGTCGATIADKAIICYRCGTATTAPTPRLPQAAKGRPWGGVLVAGVVAAGLAVVGVTLPPESAEQIASFAGAAASLLGGGALWFRARR